MLKNRLIFGALMIAVLAGLLYADARLADVSASSLPAWLTEGVGLVSLNGLIVTFVVAALIAIGAGELRRLLSAAGLSPLAVWPVIVNLALIAIPFVAANLSATFIDSHALADMGGTVIAIAFSVVGTGIFVMRRQRTDGAAGALAGTLLSVLYLGLLGSFIVRIRVFAPAGGIWLLLYFIATVKVCDIGAFFTGMAIGKHKMIEWLSPKKTLEGLAGGVVASMVVAVVVPWLVGQFATDGSALSAIFPSLPKAAAFGVLMAFVGQAGDLVESLLKRDAHAKDSANAIPAFGGVLDVLDSPLLAAPVAWWVLLH